MMNAKGIKILTGILAFLIAITIIFTIKDKKKAPGNFQSDIVDIRASEINRIELDPGQGEESFEIVKDDKNQWEVISDSDKFLAQNNLVDNFLFQLTKLKAKQVVARSSQKWEEYHVNDSLASEVKLYKGNEILADLIIGRMTFTRSRNPYQQYPDALTYIRLANDEKVYLVEGMLKMTVNQKPDDFRDGTVIKCEIQDLKNIRFIYPGDSSMVLSKGEMSWKIEGQEADSANTMDYINHLKQVLKRNFASSNVLDGKAAIQELVLEGNNMEAIKISVYPGEDETYYLTSTLNDKTVFIFDKSELEDLFKEKSYFIKY